MKLLVSVRSMEEACAAMLGGADLIDVKEPSRGALGKADDATIEQIVVEVGGQRPVSAAMGELIEGCPVAAVHRRLDYVKWGLAGCRNEDWQEPLLELQAANSSAVVVAAYADAERAAAPDVAAVVRFVGANGFPVLLIDTWGKDGSDLLAWMSARELRMLVDELRGVGVAVALAGSLTRLHQPILQRINPACVGVRGALCAGGERAGEIDVERVRLFKSGLEALSPGQEPTECPPCHDR
jgi:(5-formylfuran-3-yl)methyl phosphate synthase